MNVQPEINVIISSTKNTMGAKNNNEMNSMLTYKLTQLN
jgi:hypothetical protein